MNTPQFKERLDGISRALDDALLNFDDYDNNQEIDNTLSNCKDEIEQIRDILKEVNK